ncbi:hypothetical protein SK128_012631, partial [Halocaridina rubra]
ESPENGVLWRSIRISHTRLIKFAREASSMNLSPNISPRWVDYICSQQCLHISWCNVWCHDPSSTSCNFFDMYVAVGYQETASDGVLCFSWKSKDYAVGALIEGEDPQASATMKVKENLIDGIYDRQAQQCYYSSDNFNPWFRLDLGSVIPVRRIMMVLQPGILAVYTKDIEVRISTEKVLEEDFPLQRLFGLFEGPAEANEEVIFQYNHSILARYVTVQRLSTQPSCKSTGLTSHVLCQIQVCHVEIN